MTGIHPTAIVHPGARLGADCVIGPYSVLGEHVVLGDRCVLHSHVVIDGHTVLGHDNILFPFACLGLKAQHLKCVDGLARTEIGDGNIFREHVTVHSASVAGGVTRMGSHNFLMAGTHVGHDCRLGSRIVMSNVAMLGGHVTVDDRAIIGGGAAVHQHTRIGRQAMIGGCSKVAQDIAPFMIADGNPARTRAINKVGLARQGVSAEAQSALKQAFKLLFLQGLTLSGAAARMESELPALPEIQHLLEFIRSSKRGLAR